LEEPYFVLATQNPLEMEGTYPLPEAQLDRFLLKLRVPFPRDDELTAILDRTTGKHHSSVEQVLSRERILEMRAIAREVAVAPHVRNYVISILKATHPTTTDAPDTVKRFVRFGASPRGAQACLLGAKIRALLEGRVHVASDDVRALAKPALRHRLILS